MLFKYITRQGITKSVGNKREKNTTLKLQNIPDLQPRTPYQEIYQEAPEHESDGID